MSYKNWEKEDDPEKLGEMMLAAIENKEYLIVQQISDKMTEFNSQENKKLENQLKKSTEKFKVLDDEVKRLLGG